MTSDWRAGISAELAALGRWFEGRLVDLDTRRHVVLSPIALEDLRELTAAIELAGSRTNPLSNPEALPSFDPDVRAAVSRFTRQYASSLTAVALTGLANGVGLPLRPERCTLLMESNIPLRVAIGGDDADVWVSPEVRPRWAVHTASRVSTHSALRAVVWRALYADHLGPLFDRILRITQVSGSLMWSNAAEWVGNLADAAVEYLPPDRASTYLEESRALLGALTLPGIEGPNPMTGLLVWERSDSPGFERGVQTRRICCITYLLPDRRGRLCQNCPMLPLADREALIRERHGVVMGTAGGPAEAQAIRIGRSRLAPTLRRSSE